MRQSRYKVIAITGYGCVTVYETNFLSEAKQVAHEYDDYKSGGARIYNTVTDVTMDANGCLVD